MSTAAERKEAKAADLREREKYITEAVATHSREKIQLCCEIILDHFGPLAARVASTLLQRGRLTLRELSRYLSSNIKQASTGSKLDLEGDDDGADGRANEALGGPSASSGSTTAPLKSQKLIQQTLLTLIQHNVCWHVCVTSQGTIVPPEVEESRGTEYFQINVDEVLPRVRFGTYLALGERHFGQEGFEIIDEVLKNGKMRAVDVIRTLDPHEDQDREDTLQDLLKELLQKAYLKPCLPKMQTSPRDRRIAYEAQIIQSRKKMLTPKQRAEIAMDAGKQLEADEKEVWMIESGASGVRRGLIPVTVTKKRRRSSKAANGHAAARKKSKMTNGHGRSHKLAASSEDEDEQQQSDDNLQIDPYVFLRVNFDRFDVHIRDEIIMQAVESRYNQTTSEVLQAMMQMDLKTRDSIPSIKDEQSAMLHIITMRDYLPPDMALKRAFDRTSLKTTLSNDTSQVALLAEIVAILLGAGDYSRAGILKRIVSPSPIVKGTTVGASGERIPSQVHIEYGNAARELRKQLLRNVVEMQFGTHGTRVMALLQDLGKLEEKHISKLTLMSMAETRDICARLFASSLLSLQEVPKASERTATRTIFLWFVDERKCISWLCDHLFKTLSRLSQRRRQEGVKEADLIQKSERIDIAQDPSKLSDMERRRLRRIKETIDIISLGEYRTWRDLFIALHLPE